MFIVSPQDRSDEFFDKLVAIEQDILNELEIPYRVLEMPHNDLGASAHRKIGIIQQNRSPYSHTKIWKPGSHLATAMAKYHQHHIASTTNPEGSILDIKFHPTLTATNTQFTFRTVD